MIRVQVIWVFNAVSSAVEMDGNWKSSWSYIFHSIRCLELWSDPVGTVHSRCSSIRWDGLEFRVMEASQRGFEAGKTSICVQFIVRLVKNRQKSKQGSSKGANFYRYDIMLSCWQADPKARPSFHQLNYLLYKELVRLWNQQRVNNKRLNKKPQEFWTLQSWF